MTRKINEQAQDQQDTLARKIVQLRAVYNKISGRVDSNLLEAVRTQLTRLGGNHGAQMASLIHAIVNDMKLYSDRAAAYAHHTLFYMSDYATQFHHNPDDPAMSGEYRHRVQIMDRVQSVLTAGDDIFGNRENPYYNRDVFDCAIGDFLQARTALRDLMRGRRASGSAPGAGALQSYAVTQCRDLRQLADRGFLLAVTLTKVGEGGLSVLWIQVNQSAHAPDPAVHRTRLSDYFTLVETVLDTAEGLLGHAAQDRRRAYQIENFNRPSFYKPTMN